MSPMEAATAPPTMLPTALWIDADFTGLHARLNYAAAILHTNGGPSANGSLSGFWRQEAAAGSHVGAQYQVKYTGVVECYVDPALVIYHAFGASEFAIGIETEDDGNNTQPWTDPQMNSIVDILYHHKVPAVMLTGTDPANGVGYHEQEASWNRDKHNCPGSVREAQIPELLARLAARYAVPVTPAPTQEEDMTVQQGVVITTPAGADHRGAALLDVPTGKATPLSSKQWSAMFHQSDQAQPKVDVPLYLIRELSVADHDAYTGRTSA